MNLHDIRPVEALPPGRSLFNLSGLAIFSLATQFVLFQGSVRSIAKPSAAWPKSVLLCWTIASKVTTSTDYAPACGHSLGLYRDLLCCPLGERKDLTWILSLISFTWCLLSVVLLPEDLIYLTSILLGGPYHLHVLAGTTSAFISTWGEPSRNKDLNRQLRLREHLRLFSTQVPQAGSNNNALHIFSGIGLVLGE